MKLSNLIPDAELLLALEPEELGLKMLPVLSSGPDQFTYNSFIDDIEFDHPRDGRQYPTEFEDPIRQALREAWTWLEGQALLVPSRGYAEPHTYRHLSRRARKLAQEPDVLRAARFRRVLKDSLHPAIREDVWALYHRGKYDTAVFEAMKAVEVAVRKAAGYDNKDHGRDMLARAFNEKSGPLCDQSTPTSEQIARRELFTGAYAAFRNPTSHRNTELDDPDEAAEIIALASLLLRIVNSRIAISSTPQETYQEA